MAGGGLCPVCNQRAAANPGDEVKKHQDVQGQDCPGEGQTAR